MSLHITNRQISERVRDSLPFVANSTYGIINANGNYVVVSYNTWIYCSNYQNFGPAINYTYYSQTTSRNSNRVSKALGIPGFGTIRDLIQKELKRNPSFPVFHDAIHGGRYLENWVYLHDLLPLLSKSGLNETYAQ